MTSDSTSDTTEAIRLLRLIRPKGPWCVTAIYADPETQRVAGDEERNTVTRIVRTASEARAFLAKYDGVANLHFTANPLDWEAVREKPRADLLTAITHLHVDIDCGEAGKAAALERLQGFDAPGSPSTVIDSGGGLQALWALDSPIEDIDAAKAMNRALVHALDGDPQCVNPAHLMRLPGSLNLPNEKKRRHGRVPVPARLLLKDKRRWPARGFARIEAPSGDADYGIVPESIDDLDALNLPPRFVEIITDGRAKGETLDGDDSRSAWAFYCAKELVKHGVPVPIIAGILHDPSFGIAESIHDREDPEREAIRTAARAEASVRGWERMQSDAAKEALIAEPIDGVGGTDASAPPKRKRAMEWNTEGASVGMSNAFIEGVLYDGQTSTITGKSFEGKSYLAVDMALHVALGRPWHGREVQRGGVLYLALEGAPGIHRRCAAWWKYNDVHRRPIPLFILSGMLDLRKDREPGIESVVEAAKALRDKRHHAPAWIVIDTLAHAMPGGSEKDDDTMSAVYRGVEAMQRAVRDAVGSTPHITLVHQTGWSATDRMRGSSVLFGNLHTEILVKPGTDNAGVRTAELTKQKDGEAGAKFRFTIAPVELDERDRRGNPVMSAVAVQSSLAAIETLPDWERNLAAIETLIVNGRPGGLPWSAAAKAKREYRLDVALAEALDIPETDAVAMLAAAEKAGAIRRGTFNSPHYNKYAAWLPPEDHNNE